jgi:hypothetical protein
VATSTVPRCASRRRDLTAEISRRQLGTGAPARPGALARRGGIALVIAAAVAARRGGIALVIAAAVALASPARPGARGERQYRERSLTETDAVEFVAPVDKCHERRASAVDNRLGWSSRPSSSAPAGAEISREARPPTSQR